MLPITQLVPMVLQDRMFDANGQLYFPTDFPGGINGPSPNPQHPYWNPEFIGDTIVINGKAWPYLAVEPRRYRFLFLNGSNARAYEMFLTNPVTKATGPGFWVIGNDDGYLDRRRTSTRTPRRTTTSCSSRASATRSSSTSRRSPDRT
jgi:FtsP/CotA-like multicopper oxidase with cupredoxin domain